MRYFRPYKTSLYLIYFISFIGFTAIIGFMMSIGIVKDSRFYTIPLRLFVVLLMFYTILVNKYRPSHNKIIYLLFACFFSFYIFKVIIEILKGTQGLHIPGYEFILYSFIYGIIPFLFFSQRKDDDDYELMFKAIYLSGIFFSTISLSYYLKIKLTEGNFDRFHSAFDPIIFSYVGAFIIGISIMKYITDQKYKKKKMFLMVGALLGSIPFLIGGSRGPILALIIPLFFGIFYYLNLKIKIKYILFFILSIVILVLASSYLDSLSFKRLFNIYNDLIAGNVEVVRLKIWKTAFNQFLHSPIWGDSIQKQGGSHPHNLIIEVLMSTGIIGFIPYFLLLYYGIKKSIRIIKLKPTYSWIFIFFVMSFLMGMLSGTVYSDIWYWSSLALVLSMELGLNEKDKKEVNTFSS